MSQKWVVLLVNWRWWWFIFVGFKKKEKLASVRRKDIGTKHSNYSRLLILWVFRSCLPPPTFYPSHNIGFLLQKSNKEVVPPLKEKNRRQDLLANMPAWLQGTPTWKMVIMAEVSSSWHKLLKCSFRERFPSSFVTQAPLKVGSFETGKFSLHYFRSLTPSVNWVFIRFPRQKNSDGISLKTKEISQMARKLGIG